MNRMSGLVLWLILLQAANGLAVEPVLDSSDCLQGKECENFAFNQVKPMQEYFDQLISKNNKNDVELINKNNRILELEDLKTIEQFQTDFAAGVTKELQKQYIKLDNLENYLVGRQKEMINALRLYVKSNALKFKKYDLKLKNQKEIYMHQIAVCNLKAQVDELSGDRFSGFGEEENVLYDVDSKKIYQIHGNKENNQEKKVENILAIDMPDFANIPLSKGYTDPKLYDSDIAGPGWTVIQQRVNGKVDFYRNWETYRFGFGDFWDGDFFLGLEKIHQLTNEQPHELFILMESFNGSTFFARYNDFAISNEFDQYRISKLDGFSGNTTDELMYHKGSAFTTFDRNNDALTQDYNCAEDFRSAWWYKLCAKCNMNGNYHTTEKKAKDGIYWGLNGFVTLKEVRMMIRPKADSE